jgi:hypothetical protein
MNPAPSGLYAIDFIGSQGAARGLLHVTPLGSIEIFLKRRRELNVVILAISPKFGNAFDFPMFNVAGFSCERVA